MRNYASGFRLTDRLERYRSQTRQPGLQIDLPAAHTTVSVMRGAASHSVNRFLTSATDLYHTIQYRPGLCIWCPARSSLKHANICQRRRSIKRTLDLSNNLNRFAEFTRLGKRDC